MNPVEKGRIVLILVLMCEAVRDPHEIFDVAAKPTSNKGLESAQNRVAVLTVALPAHNDVVAQQTKYIERSRPTRQVVRHK